jgi:hypothetical protein
MHDIKAQGWHFASISHKITFFSAFKLIFQTAVLTGLVFRSIKTILLPHADAVFV